MGILNSMHIEGNKRDLNRTKQGSRGRVFNYNRNVLILNGFLKFRNPNKIIKGTKELFN